MTFSLHGVPVSGGIAIGRAHLLSRAGLEAVRYLVPERQVAAEVRRYTAALTTVRKELAALRADLPAGAPQEFEAFIDLHVRFLEDVSLSQAPIDIIKRERCNAEWALKLQADNLLKQFDDIEDDYLRERKADIAQVAERLMKALIGRPGHETTAADKDGEWILVAHDLSPADAIHFKQRKFASFITDLGGTTSHTAIVARSLNIPSIVALHYAHQLIGEGETLIVDGTQGVVIVDPDAQTLSEYKLRQYQWELERQKLRRLRDTRAVTLDGTEVTLQANIELSDDVKAATQNGANGVGLFRTEFLFLNRTDLPDENEQFETYRKVVKAMDGMPVTIRTYDLGADKQMAGATSAAPNPALGLRAIRLSLAEPQMFLTQLRAILRASHYGKVRILVPMLMSVAEIQQTFAYIEQAKQELAERRVAYDKSIEIGGMIEIPAAALALNGLLRKLDFISIGTNDLIQYTLAIDRADDTVSHLYDPYHPAVLQLLAHIIKTANNAGKPVAVCGEMAGDIEATRLLLGLGLRQFSMHPARLLEIKQRVLQSDIKAIEPVVKRVLRADEPEKLLSQLNA